MTGCHCDRGHGQLIPVINVAGGKLGTKLVFRTEQEAYRSGDGPCFSGAGVK